MDKITKSYSKMLQDMINIHLKYLRDEGHTR